MILSEIKTNVLIGVTAILFGCFIISSTTAYVYKTKNEKLKSDILLLNFTIASYEQANEKAALEVKENARKSREELAALALVLAQEREAAKGAIGVASREIERLEGLTEAPSDDKGRLLYIDNMINKSIGF